jgi:DNA-binding NarL/FixJ family response regulator
MWMAESENSRQRAFEAQVRMVTSLSAIALAGVLLAINLASVARVLTLLTTPAAAITLASVSFAALWFVWLVLAVRLAMAHEPSGPVGILEVEPPPRAQAWITQKSLRVLLVKSADPEMDDLTAYVLRRSLLDVVGPVPPDEALKIVDADPPAVVVVDADLPHVDAFEFTLKVRNEKSHPGVVLLSSQRAAMTEQRAPRSGADVVISKPWPSSELVSAIHYAVRSGADRANLETSAPIVSKQSLGNLTAREREILTLIAEGLSNMEMAAALGVSTSTALQDIQRILAKLGVANRDAAIAAAVSAGLRGQSEPRPS